MKDNSATTPTSHVCMCPFSCIRPEYPHSSKNRGHVGGFNPTSISTRSTRGISRAHVLVNDECFELLLLPRVSGIKKVVALARTNSLRPRKTTFRRLCNSMLTSLVPVSSDLGRAANSISLYNRHLALVDKGQVIHGLLCEFETSMSFIC